MNKTYTFQKAQLNETAKNQAAINYYLVDDQGKQRVVPAVAKLGFGKKVKTVRAKYYRETPLVEALAQAKEQQQVEVSYTEFNKQPRISLLPEARKTPTISMYGVDTFNDDETLEKSISTPKYLTLGLFAILATVLWFVSLSITTV